MDSEPAALAEHHSTTVSINTWLEDSLAARAVVMARLFLFLRGLVAALGIFPVERELASVLVQVGNCYPNGVLAEPRPEYNCHPLESFDFRNLAVPSFTGCTP